MLWGNNVVYIFSSLYKYLPQQKCTDYSYCSFSINNPDSTDDSLPSHESPKVNLNFLFSSKRIGKIGTKMRIRNPPQQTTRQKTVQNKALSIWKPPTPLACTSSTPRKAIITTPIKDKERYYFLNTSIIFQPNSTNGCKHSRSAPIVNIIQPNSLSDVKEQLKIKT